MKKYNTIKHYLRALAIAIFVLSPLRVCANFNPGLPATGDNSDIGGEGTGGWTPTDAGLVVQLKPNESFRLSTVIKVNGKNVEYFICDNKSYPDRYQENPFGYPTDASGNFLKLIPREADGDYPGGSLWTVREPVKRSYNLVEGIDGIVYSMWSSSNQTLTTENNNWEIKNGALTSSSTGKFTCDVVFAIPTVRSRVNMDPNNTLGRKVGTQWAFDGQMGTDTLGNVWREVYWFHKSKENGPYSYASTGLTAFNKSTGKAYQINGKYGGRSKQRMLFRLYIVQDHPFASCDSSYFFAHDEQNYLKFVKFTSTPILPSDTTRARKIYTHDHLHCMDRIGTSEYYQSGFYQIPEEDSVFFYIGKHNNFFANRGTNPPTLGPTAGSFSAFTNIRQLRIRPLANESTPFIAPVGAYGRIVVDTTSGATNLGATFDPVGYFFRTSSGVNVPMVQVDDTTWITADMWHIAGEYMNLKGIVKLYTGTSFSATDPGASIADWSDSVPARSIPVYGHPGWTAEGRKGWARIHTNRPATNGGIEFVLADTLHNYIEYSNNGCFGTELPKQYPLEGTTKVTVQAPQLLEGYVFYGWNTTADTTTGTLIPAGTVIDFEHLPDGVTLDGKALKLYAKAKYTGSINVAISFLKDDGKRYFMSFPTTGAAYMSAQTYNDWTNTCQGMESGIEDEPDYMASFKMIGQPTCVECAPTEYVLDPHRSTMHGSEDSLVFYENYQIGPMDYVGLYYDPNDNTVLHNDNWAGLFQSSRGWPTPAQACIDSTRLYSTHYLMDWPNSKRKERLMPNPAGPAGDSIPMPSSIQYNAEDNQFHGVADTDSTIFTLSGVGVVDGYYIILPDTTDAASWTDSIVFAFHENQTTVRNVWSKLIGKQLLAQMKVGKDTIYFHPNRDKIITDVNALATSRDFRLTHDFEYLRDARVEALHVVEPDDKPDFVENGFLGTVTSGESSPMNVQLAGGQYIDMVDTLRVWLRPSESSRIKKYYGRWNENASGVYVQADGSRYRDILVKTKTYHYGPTQKTLRLVPEQESYSFGSLKNVSDDVTFTLELISWHELLDVDGNLIRVDTISIADTTSILDLTSATFTLKKGSEIFAKGDPTRLGIRLTTQEENTTASNRDTLSVTTNVNLGGVLTPVSVEVPLLQVSTIGTELIWSVEYMGHRKFIVATNTTFDFREYSETDSRLKYSGNELIKGSNGSSNSNKRYITPWKWFDTDPNQNQLTLKTEYGINRWFRIKDETTPEVSASDSSTLTFYMYDTYTNSNGNYEEIVKLKYGDNKWLSYNGSALVLVNDSADASLFSWAYMIPEYYLQNNGYPNNPSNPTPLEFGYYAVDPQSIQTRYKAYLDHSMLLNNELVRLCKTEERDIAYLINPSQQWKTLFTDSIIRDSRVATPSGLSMTLDTASLTTTITPTGSAPTEVKYKGRYVNIVDTLDFRITLQPEAPEYRFADKWSSFSSVENAHLKIPLIRRTFHEEFYDSIICSVEHDEYNYAFPAVLRDGVRADSLHTFSLSLTRHAGKKVYNVDNQLMVATKDLDVDSTSAMHLDDITMAQIVLKDDHGDEPTWCKIEGKGSNSVIVRCSSNGIRTPRMAYLKFIFIVMIDGKARYVNYRLSVSQASYFQYANNQTLFHTAGASGDPMDSVTGLQQVHENKRILYYYNPKPYHVADQEVELPLRERGFHGWWRWYREGKDQNGVDVSDTDIPDSVWITPPRNVSETGKTYNFPFRIIGDSVKVPNPDGEEGDSIKQLVTMGRYTVFYYPSNKYGNKWDPPSKTPRVHAPWNKDTVTYAVDISNYYDNLPLSTANMNQIDTAKLYKRLDTIYEPTLSLREVYELHPWTEMAERMEHYKTSKDGPFTDDEYMEDHVVMAPTGTRLLLQTEQRYVKEHFAVQWLNKEKTRVKREGHSESLLGYYMRDDNWNNPAWDSDRRDTMIWCGGWDADCQWFTYNPTTHTYDSCFHPVTVDDDFLNVPIKGGISSGHDFDTVYYCLRARSKKTETLGTVDSPDPEEPADGDYWFNICRYMIIYHAPEKYGPMLETNVGGEMKALKTNDEIEQNYEILEQLNFDYNKPGSDYTIYPHPLPWRDVTYGYTYPLTSSALPNRFHKQTDFPGPGEYALINKIPTSEHWKSQNMGSETYWRTFEQHGGAENGYMLYCDGMSASGQVAALSLQTKLCEGQKLYFSGYVANASNQSGKSNPNFTFSVQGSEDGKVWEDVTSYMTGDIDTSDYWYQIFFPIEFTQSFEHFRVRIYNMASTFDGNDFIIDDMCIFATKPPLVAYQANTKCVEQNDTDSIIHVVLRVDYQGFIDDEFNNKPVFYAVDELTLPDSAFRYVPMIDGYLNNTIHTGTPDTVFGWIRMPARTYEPSDEDSIFVNLQQLADRFEASIDSQKVHPELPLFRQGYIYERLDDEVRPVLYVVHKAKMIPKNRYTVRMSLNTEGLTDSSQCAVTSILNVTSRMKLVLNGEEKEDKEVSGICGNVTHDLSLRVRGTLIENGTAPVDLAGSCVNDWLLYGDTAYASSKKRYGYCYSDIVHVVKDILRYEPVKGETNVNQFVRSLGGVSRSTMGRIKNATGIKLETSDHPYTVLTNLVNNGFLILYQSNLSVTVGYGDSVQYVIFPILGTGSDEMHEQSMDVCPTPLLIKLKSKENTAGAPMIIGGLHRDSTQMNTPVIVLADAIAMADGVMIPVDSIRSSIGVRSVDLFATDDPNYREGVHRLAMTPDRPWPGDYLDDYYHKGDTIILTTSSSNNYSMRPGYNYTFNLEMVDPFGGASDTSGCPIGDVPFTISYVPDYLRWAPRDSLSNQWNNPANWVGINGQNKAIHEEARFAPLPTTKVVIPAMTDGMPYPVLPATIGEKDSVKEVGFAYNVCDAIRFLPGAAIGQQQNMIYNDVIIDMSIPNQTWQLRAAPVTGLISGDLFMSNADLIYESDPWQVGVFDADGRNNTLGTGSFYLSVYNRETQNLGDGGSIKDTTYTAKSEWSKVTNGMTLSLPPASGWAVYSRTKSGKAAEIRLPKNDDEYYYYTKTGEKNGSETGLRAMRDGLAGAIGAGKLTYQPTAGAQDYTISKGVADSTFVFGNPTMGYIDIWGMIADNNELSKGIKAEFSYLDDAGHYTQIPKSVADLSANTLDNLLRYLPPMRAIILKATPGTSLVVKLNANRIVTDTVSVPAATPAPIRRSDVRHNRGIMTVTAVNPVSSRCVSRLLIGQGYHDAIYDGEDAILTTVNIDKFHMTNTPTTPFNLYSVRDGYGLCVDLRDSVVNIPVSFCMSDLPYDPVTSLWFTGVNSIDGPLVLYDALLGTQRKIIDGVCLDIETPETNNELRYYIRRPDYQPEDPSTPIATGLDVWSPKKEQAYKFIRNGIVYILRNGHVYTTLGQQVR